MKKIMTELEEIKISVKCQPSIEQVRQTKSILTRSQKQSETRFFYKEGFKPRIKVVVRYDDECGNGHNSFSITGTIDKQNKNYRWIDDCGGCIHEEIAKYFPKLQPYIKWHLMDSGSPIHYIANALCHAGHTEYKDAKNEEHLKSTIIYGALEADYQTDFMSMNKEELTKCLQNRLPLLLKEFRKAVESLGFIY